MSNNAVTICTENTECILVTSQEFESTEQDRTAICSSNTEKDKKKYDVDFEMDNHRCCSFPMDNVSVQELDEGKISLIFSKEYIISNTSWAKLEVSS